MEDLTNKNSMDIKEVHEQETKKQLPINIQ